MRGYKLTFFGLLLLAVALNVFVLFAAYTGNDVIDFTKWNVGPGLENLQSDLKAPNLDKAQGSAGDVLKIVDEAKNNLEKAAESLGK